MVDLSKINGKLEAIRLCLGRLEKLQKASREEFLADFRLADAAKHNLQIAIEATIDVANHSSAAVARPDPEAVSRTTPPIIAGYKLMPWRPGIHHG